MSRTSGLRIACATRPDAMAEAELEVLVAVYRFLLLRGNANKKATEPEGSDDAEDLELSAPAQASYPSNASPKRLKP